MRQFIGMIGDDRTLSDLALSLVAPPLREAGRRLSSAAAALSESEESQLRYAHALAHWGEVGGYEAEVLFDTVAVAILDRPWEDVKDRPVRTLSGGEQKRFALDLLVRGGDEVLLLDEPDNFLDVPAKRWLEGPAAGVAEVSAVRVARPGAAGADRRPGGRGRGRQRVDPPGRLRVVA
jgi:ATPase subunit of ABC transporter with duplicated ATPase domains